MRLAYKTLVLTFIILIFSVEVFSQKISNASTLALCDIDGHFLHKKELLFTKDILMGKQPINYMDQLVSETNDNYGLAQEIINYSKQFIGSRYRRGAKGPNVFDCSGFTSFVFKKFGINLSSACVVQVNQGISAKKEELTTGDLIFFKGRSMKSARIGHVGIVISNNDGNIKFIHACNRGVTIDELEKSSYYRPRYVKGLKVLGEQE